MNRIANTNVALLLTLLLWAGCNVPATETVSTGGALAYAVKYEISIAKDSTEARVRMHVKQARALLREVRFTRGPAIRSVSIDGETLAPADEIVWRPTASGGTLEYSVTVENRRGDDHYDALLAQDWGIFRAEDLIPRAATRVLEGAYSKTTMTFDLPSGWSVVTGYAAEDNQFTVVKPDRNFDQPSGWIAVGRLGVRREVIADMQVVVAGPVGHGVRRMDVLALLNWTLPELSRALGKLPPRLTIVSATDPMWRGGLSGPHTLYLHADRPLLSENSTSTLLHEVMHSVLRISAAPGYDWIVEGVAEYYSLELLRRSGTISEKRFAKALATQKEWAQSAENLCQRTSKGATTALAVTIMHELDTEIRKNSAGAASLDDVLRALKKGREDVSLASLEQSVADISEPASRALQLDKLPGCRSIQSDS